LPPSTAFYLYTVQPRALGGIGPRRGIVATLGLAGLRVTELSVLQNQHLDLEKSRIYVRDSKTPAGVRIVDIRPRLQSELAAYQDRNPTSAIEAPAFPTRNGTRGNKDTIRAGVILPVVARANEIRRGQGRAPIRAHVTPHTFRRTYITFMLAAGFDVPYVQDQVGHLDPTTTLAVYAQVIRRPDRDALRAEMRALLGDDRPQQAGHDRQLELTLGVRQSNDGHERIGLER
jgi:integrase